MTNDEILQAAKEAGIPCEIGRPYEHKRTEFQRIERFAAIIKATKPLEDQLAAAQEEIERLTERNATNEEYAANLVKALTKTQDQLDKAEQRVAEACALTYLEDYDLTDIAERVRAGEYRKFMKGE